MYPLGNLRFDALKATLLTISQNFENGVLTTFQHTTYTIFKNAKEIGLLPDVLVGR